MKIIEYFIVNTLKLFQKLNLNCNNFLVDFLIFDYFQIPPAFILHYNTFLFYSIHFYIINKNSRYQIKMIFVFVKYGPIKIYRNIL